MTAPEAIERLDDMQAQIIHGKRTFGDIADVIRALVKREEQCRKILGYEDGDLLDNVTRYKSYAESEIALRDNKARQGLAYIEKLQAAHRGRFGDGEIELEVKAARDVLAEAPNLT